jgi:hypothetical protein
MRGFSGISKPKTGLTIIESISKSVDVIVFAQGSMSRLLLEAQNRVSTPILECIDSGVKQVKIHFDLQR